MLHLFNNVFIEQDKFINLNSAPSIVVVSSEYATNDVKKSDAVEQADANMASLLGDTSYKAWFTGLMSKKNKVMIYADAVNFANITATWLKSTVNLDQDTFNVIADCYNHKLKTESKQNSALITSLKESFAEAKAIDFSDVDFSPSFEFLFASGLNDADFAKKGKLVSLLSKFIKREYEDMILEARRHLDVYVLDQDLQTVLGSSGKDITNFTDITALEVYKEPHWRDEINVPVGQSYHPGSSSKIDISKASTSNLNALCALTDKINIAVMGESVERGATGLVGSRRKEVDVWTYVHAVAQGELSDEQYKAALQEIVDEPIALLHVPVDLDESILLVLVSYFKSLKKTSNLSTLAKFTLK